MRKDERINLYRIETEEEIERVQTIESFTFAATSIRQALNLFEDSYSGKHIVSIREIELEVGNFYDL